MKTTKFFARCGVWAMLLGATAQCLGAVDYFVSTAGNDMNPGTESKPWKSAARAGQGAGPGDRVFFAEGIYSDTDRDGVVLRPRVSGTADHPISFEARDGVVAFERSHTIIDLSNRSHIQVRGIVVRDVLSGGGHWVNMNGSSYCVLSAMKFTFSGQSHGVGWEGIRLAGASYNRITDSHLEKWGIYGNPYQNGGDMIQLSGASHHNLIEGNFIGAAGHAGLQIDGGYLNIVRKNIFANPIEKGLELTFRGNSRPEDFRWNLVEENDFREAGYNSELHGGMHLHLNSSFNIVRRNTFRDAGTLAVDMQVWGEETKGTQGNRFFHNTLVHNGIHQNRLPAYSTTGLEIADFGYDAVPQGRHIVKNNIFYDNLPVNGQLGNPGDNVVFFMELHPGRTRSAGPFFDTVFAGNLVFGSSAGARTMYIAGAGDPSAPTGFLGKYGQLVFGNTEKPPRFAMYDPGVPGDPADGKWNLRLLPGSPGVDEGLPLTITLGAGSGTRLTVQDALFFHAGFDGMIPPDRIMVGGREVTITAIDYDAGTISIGTALTWRADTPVTLVFSGKGPDAGAFETSP